MNNTSDNSTIHMLATVVPALGDPRHERPHAVYGHVINVPTHFNFKLPLISSHLPNTDADSHLLVVSTCKQMPRFRWSIQPKIAWFAQISVLSSRVTNEQYFTSSRVINHVVAANQPLHWLCFFYEITS